MAAVISAAAAPATTFARTSTPRASAAATTSAVGLPRLACKGGRRARGSMAARPRGTATAGAASVLTMTVSAGPVLALVDDRLTTEGTGLSLGISNNLLAWILLGVFGLIWALYFLYTSTLEEDDDSALSL